MIIFDLDNTLRNNDGSLPFVPEDKTKAINWVPWQDWVNENGVPIERMCLLYMQLRQYYPVAIVTSSSFGTKDWLRDQHLPTCTIRERALDDDRDPFTYKRDFIDEHCNDITLWVDDSNRVCDYAESLGIPVIRVTSKLGAIDYDH